MTGSIDKKSLNLTVVKNYKRKLILTKEQIKRIDSWIGACRYVYNLGLEVRIAAYRNLGKTMHKYELMKQITGIRYVEWIKDVPLHTIQNTMDRLDFAYKRFFKGSGFPKFASKKSYKSIFFRPVKVSGNYVTLPKIGKIKMFKDSEIIGTPKTAILIKDPDGYFICIYCEDAQPKFISENQAIGLDMGISHFCIDSNGNFIKNPRHFKKHERKLRIANRSLSRKKKGSNRWEKQVKVLSKLHHTIGNVRRDFLHKESTKIAKKNSIVYVEDLNIKGMVKNKKLSKHILDCGWGMFRTMLEYKTNVVKINPKHTSQTCFECGSVDAKNRVSQSKFICTNCGHVSNADVNAAKNILSKGIALNRQREALACA